MNSLLHTCSLCEAVCGIQVESDGHRLGAIRGDKDDPFSRGHICPKAVALRDIQADPDRVQTPLRRVGTRFEPVSWDDALNEVATQLARVQKRYGRSAVALYQGNPSVHSYSALLASTLFRKVLGSKSQFSPTSADQLPHMLAALQLFGHQLLMPVPDLGRAHHLLIIGANPAVSNGSIMTAPGVGRRLQAIRARGGKVVVVDPRRTETARLADAHHFIRPESDALLLLALLHEVFRLGAVRLGHLEPRIKGLEALRETVAKFPPSRVAAFTGIEEGTITQLAAEFCAAPSAVCYGRVGACTQRYGGLTAWLINVLNVVTGNVDRPGGAMFTNPGVDLVDVTARLGDSGHFGIWRSRVSKLPEFSGELPVAALSEEIDTPGEGQIRALITFAGNPVLSTPNGMRLDRALDSLEFMVSIDLYRNETTRHANIILPTTFGPERDHYDLALYTLAVQNVARYVKPVVAAPPLVRDDWEVLAELGLRLHACGGGRQSRAAALTLRTFKALGPQRVLDLLLRMGPHRLSLKKLQAQPHGIDLGPLQPRLPERLKTKDGFIDVGASLYLDDVHRLEAELNQPPPASLVLVGRRRLASNNSWLHNSPTALKGQRCTVLMHPDDAADRQITEGQKVEMSSRVGLIQAVVQVSDEMMRGVVSLPHGWGHQREGVVLQVAQSNPGVSVNDLTDEAWVDPLSGTAALSGVPVEVRPLDQRRNLAS